MATVENTELIDRFEEFYRNYYRNEIGELAQKYPNDQKSLYLDWEDIAEFDEDLAYDYRMKPSQLQEFAEEALRLYDLPVDVSLGQAHVRVQNLPNTIDVSEIEHRHHGNLVAIDGFVKDATDTRPKVTEAAFECQRCGTLTRIPQAADDFQEPHECQGCEREGPFRLNTDHSQFIMAQEFTLQSTSAIPESRGPDQIEVRVEDDIAGVVVTGGEIRLTGVVKMDQIEQDGSKTPAFEPYLDGVSVVIDDEGDSVQGREQSMQTYATNAKSALVGLPDTAREEETKAKLITPFIEALGWDKFDSSEVRLEYEDEQTGKLPDYALFGSGSDSPDIVVEAKKRNRNLDNHEQQIYSYIKIFDAQWGVLSNGTEFRLYRNNGDNPVKVGTLDTAALPQAAVLNKLHPTSISQPD